MNSYLFTTFKKIHLKLKLRLWLQVDISKASLSPEEAALLQPQTGTSAPEVGPRK